MAELTIERRGRGLGYIWEANLPIAHFQKRRWPMLGGENDLHGNSCIKKWKLYRFLIIVAFSQIIKVHCEEYLWLTDIEIKF